MTAETSKTPLDRNDCESPTLIVIPGHPASSLSSERELQLLRLGLVSGRGLNAHDAARLAGELPTAELKMRSQQYLEDCELHNNPGTLHAKADALEKFFWYLETHNHEKCSEREIRGFLSYIKNSHLAPGGRWGMAHGPEAQRYLKPASKRTVQYYFVYLRGLLRWMVDQDFLLRDPSAKIKIERPEKPLIEPFSLEQVDALVRMARRSTWPSRNEAIIVCMFDTGLRAHELCNMRLSDLELKPHGGKVRIVGKGDKERIVPFGRCSRKLLGEYLKSAPLEGGLKIWSSRRGPAAGESLRPNGLLHLYWRIGNAARIHGVRCSPHTMRHTFAINYLRNKGTVETLQYLLGHEKIEDTMKYARIVALDAEVQHRMCSPADALWK
jgi:site-specific recombinase XerD